MFSIHDLIQLYSMLISGSELRMLLVTPGGTLGTICGGAQGLNSGLFCGGQANPLYCGETLTYLKPII